MPTYAFVDGTVFDGAERIAAKSTVVVRDGVIQAVGQDIVAPPESTPLAMRGRFVMPGLIDAHVHITCDSGTDHMDRFRELTPFTAVRAARFVRQTLLSGFTTIRDVGGVGYANVAVKQAIAEGHIVGPRMLSAGHYLSMTGRHEFAPWRTEVEITASGRVDSPDDARRTARRDLYYGADLVKLLATGNIHSEGTEPHDAELTVEEMRAAVEVAHNRRKRVAAHAHGTRGIKNAVLAGVDTIEHGSFLDDEAVAMMRDAGVFLVPTLSVVHQFLTRGSAHGLATYAQRKTLLVRDALLESVRRAREAGLQIALGTDSGMQFVDHGDNALELVLMVEAGFSPLEALRCGTSVAAAALGLGEEVGRIRAGYRADLLVVDGDPLEDVGVLRDPARIHFVMRDGVLYKAEGALRV